MRGTKAKAIRRWTAKITMDSKDTLLLDGNLLRRFYRAFYRRNKKNYTRHLVIPANRFHTLMAAIRDRVYATKYAKTYRGYRKHWVEQMTVKPKKTTKK